MFASVYGFGTFPRREEMSRDKIVQRLNRSRLSREDQERVIMKNSKLRSQLFERGVRTELANSGEALEWRSETAQKYVDGVWMLAGAIRERSVVVK